MAVEDNYVIYKDDELITLVEALEVDIDVLALPYVPVGKRNKSNPHWTIAVLSYLRDHNQIDSFEYVGPDLEKLDSVKDRVY